MFVFPAFNNSYNTRKRTFRCCKKCRTKRIRCKLSDQYETLGCDNCKARNVTCDLVTGLNVSEDIPVKLEPGEDSFAPNAYSENTSQGSNTTKRPGSNDSRLSKRQQTQPTPLRQPANFANSENSLRRPGPVKVASYTAQNPTHKESYDSTFDRKHENVSQPYESTSMAMSSSHLSLPERPQSFPNALSPPLHENSAQAFVYSEASLSIPTEKPVSQTVGTEGFPQTFDQPQNISTSPQQYREHAFPGSSEYSSKHSPAGNVPIHVDQAYIDSVEAIIHKIDYRYLKTHFDFNITYRQSRFYFSKISSRKQNGNVNTSTEDRMSVRHLKKVKCLDHTDLPLFKFLLTINAFTLDTPGFYSISEPDLVKLLEIYFYKINSIFPIVFEAEFWELYKRNRIPNIILYAVVLNAARDELSEPILARSFVKNGATFQTNLVRFLKELDLKIRQLLTFLPELGDTEKLARLITHLLLSLCFKMSQIGNEQSSSDIGDCVSYAYSLVIHHQFFHKRLEEAGASKKSAYLKRLWWTIFVFDRFNGLLNGKAMYINPFDFNIERPNDMPHLNRLIDLASILEGTLLAVFRPSAKDRNPTTINFSNPDFNPSKVIENEMKVVADFDAVKKKLRDYKKYQTGASSHLPDMPMNCYRDRMVFFLERLVHYQVLLFLRTGQAKYSGEDPHFDEFSLHIGKQLYEMLDLLKDGQQYRLVMSTPLIPSIILVAFSVSMTARLKVMRGDKDIQNIEQHKITEAIESAKNFLGEIKHMSSKWWFVQEVMVSLERLNLDSSGSPPSSKKSPFGSDSSAAKRSKLSIDSLVTEVADPESVLPSSHSITSPGIYEDVIDKEESEGEENGDYEKDQPVSNRALIPPMLFSNVLETPIATYEDSAVKRFDQPTMADPLSSRGSVTSGDDVHFDVAGLVDVVNNEANFMPNVMEFLSDANFDFWN